MITLPKAKKALEAAEKRAKELGINVSTVIVDDHGSIVSSSRMDGAIPISPQFAYTKAFTSANLGFATKDLGPFTNENKPYFGINTLFGGELTTIAGGIPVVIAGKLSGGVGVGGSQDTMQDHECAQAAIDILTS